MINEHDKVGLRLGGVVNATVSLLLQVNTKALWIQTVIKQCNSYKFLSL